MTHLAYGLVSASTSSSMDGALIPIARVASALGLLTYHMLLGFALGLMLVY